MNDRDAELANLAARQHGVFQRRQALGLGFSGSTCARRLSRGLWRPTGHDGVYALRGWPPSWRQRLLAAVLAGPEGTVASHRSAAVLHGVREGEPVEITVPRGANRQKAALVHQGLVPLADRRRLDGIPVTRIERTLVDLAAVTADSGVEQAVEAAFRQGLTTEARLLRARRRGRPGAARLGVVLERRAPGRPAGSDLEVRFLQLVRAAGLPEPVRQYEVVSGGERFFLDFAYPLRRLCIELDGRAAHEGTAFERDRARQNALVLAGWTVLRFTWADVTGRPEYVLALLARSAA